MSDDLLNPPGRPCREALRAAEREALMQVLRENDVLSLDGIHLWRCSYPDEYGPCQCADQVTDAILEAGFRLIPPSVPSPERIAAEHVLLDVWYWADDNPSQLKTHGCTCFDRPRGKYPAEHRMSRREYTAHLADVILAELTKADQ